MAHKCICPSWADTEIVSGAKTSQEEREGLNKSIKVILHFLPFYYITVLVFYHNVIMLGGVMVNEVICKVIW